MAKLSDAEVNRIWEAAQKGVTVSCDEYEAHSARRGCLRGDAKDIVICKLAETILEERKAAREFFQVLGKGS
jgi:hypothetical protein